VVIGAGPSGASCGLWLHQLGCNVLVLEKSDQIGGLQKRNPYVNVWVPSIRGMHGYEIAENLHHQILEAGVPVQFNTEVNLITKTDGGFVVDGPRGGPITAQYIVLASGTRFRTGGFTANENFSIGPGKTFEALGVTGKKVAILGGGDNAYDAFAFAVKRGAAEVRLFATKVRAQSLLRSHVPEECVSVGKFVVDQQAMTVNGEHFDKISVQFGFEAVVPKGLEAIELTERGHVKADLWGVTSMDKVLGVGELANTFHPCTTTSFAHGIQAAKYIHKRIEGLS